MIRTGRRRVFERIMRTIAKYLLVALAWTGTAALPAAQAAGDPAAQPGLLRFEVSLDDRTIGEHSLRFDPQPDGSLRVAIDIDLDIKFGPFTVFRYSHRNRTHWQAGQLVSLQSETDDNGTRHRLRAVSGTDVLEVYPGDDAPTVMRSSTLPSTYWMYATTRQTVLLNSQTGEALNVSVLRIGHDPVPGPDGSIPATRYRMDGDLKIDLWYDDVGALVGLAFEARGSQITYRLVDRQGDVPVNLAGWPAPPRTQPG